MSSDDEYPSGPRLTPDYFRHPSSARVWDYWLGGKDNYAVDRKVGDTVAGEFPGIRDLARQSRQFLVRGVRYLVAEAGIRQFLDIGTGLPTVQNTHEIAQALAPESKIVYVDNDPVVLAHARALLRNTTDEGVTAYVDADVNDPELIISDARNVLNFGEPIAVILQGILGHATPELARMYDIVNRVMAPVPPGSYLLLSDGIDGEQSLKVNKKQHELGHHYHLRTPEQIARCFGGLELVEPGVVSISMWRPDPADIGTPVPVESHGGVARKPPAGRK